MTTKAIDARSDETRNAAQPERRERGAEGMSPNTTSLPKSSETQSEVGLRKAIRAIVSSGFTMTADERTDEILALVSPSLPTGMVAVPVTPTEEMIEAGDDCYGVAGGNESWVIGGCKGSENIWAAMLAAAPKTQPSLIGLARDGVAGVATIPADRAARQLMGLYYELCGNSDMAADVRSDDWDIGTGSGPGSERELLAVMAAMIMAVREEFAAALSPPPEQHGESNSDRLSVPAEATRAWAVTLANIRQGQSSTPRCEPPGEADINSAANMIRMVLRAALILTGKEG